MKPLKIGITGVRGIVGETFTPEVAVGFAQAFGTYLDSGRILVCRDTRLSGPMVRSAVVAGLLAAGCEVIDLGICPTPSLQLAVTWLKADGGIAGTAGHNPAPWNALKFVRGDGLYLNPLQAEELLDVFHQGEFAKARWNQIQPAIHTGTQSNTISKSWGMSLTLPPLERVASRLRSIVLTVLVRDLFRVGLRNSAARFWRSTMIPRPHFRTGRNQRRRPWPNSARSLRPVRLILVSPMTQMESD